MTHILDLFRKSPFEPLYEHRLKVRECTDLVKPLFETIFSGEIEKQKQITRQICDSERQADLLKEEIRRTLPKGIFLSVNREDLLRYLKIQDDLADTVEDIAVVASVKVLQAPSELRVGILAYVETVLNVCTLADKATNHLKSLVATGFRGEDVSSVIDLVERSVNAEREADDAGLEMAKKLFQFEDEMKATDVMLWFKILDLVGDLADYADKTGEWLKNMLEK